MKWELLHFSYFEIQKKYTNASHSKVIESLKANELSPEKAPTDFFREWLEKDKLPIAINFKPTNNEHENELHDLLNQLAFNDEKEKIEVATEIATKLVASLHRRAPEINLFVIIHAIKGNLHKISLWKLPAGEVLEPGPKSDKPFLKHLEKVFSKENKYFKAATFVDEKSKVAFWKGFVEDNQTRRKEDVATYWLEKFLTAEKSMSDKYGTRLLIEKTREVIAESSSEEQDKILNALSIVHEKGKNMTMRNIVETYYPDDVKDKIFPKISKGSLDIPFSVVDDIYKKLTKYKELKVEIKNEGVIKIIGKKELLDKNLKISKEDGLDKIVLKGEIIKKDYKQKQ